MPSVPLLLDTVEAVLHRLDPVATRASDPPGPALQGYDDVFREPVVYDTDTGASVDTRTSTRRELPPIRLPCQVETTLFENLQMGSSGDSPQTRMTLVVHRTTLLLMGLIDLNTGNLLINKADRVTRFERPGLGTPVLTLPEEGLFVTQVTPASWGFSDGHGHDLWLIYIDRRERGNQ